jgi:hypothetical protein
MNQYRYDEIEKDIYIIEVKRFGIWWDYYKSFYTKEDMMECVEQLRKEGHKVVEMV